MKNIVYITLLFFSAGIFSCQNQIKPGANAGSINSRLSVDEFETKLSAGNAQLLDVRTAEEFNQGHLKGAMNYDIRSSEFESQLSTLDKNKPVFVYCLSGGRSSSAAGLMEDKGFKEVYNMQGGIMKWNAAGKALDDGTVPAVDKGMTEADFSARIKSDKQVLVDYNAKWCKPCLKMAPMLDALAERKKDKLILLKIDADENQALLKEKGIEAIPVLELYKNGQKIWTHAGEISESDLIEQTGL